MTSFLRDDLAFDGMLVPVLGILLYVKGCQRRIRDSVEENRTFFYICCSKIWKFQILFVSLQRSGEKSALAEEALCSKLAQRKPEKFSCKADNSRRAERLPRIMRGAVSPFSIIGFSQDPRCGTGKGSPALLLCVAVKQENESDN